MILDPDQIDGVLWIRSALEKHKGIILADIMGKGKSAQAIEVVRFSHKPVLIISPAYLIYNWFDELQLWGYDRTICTIDSTKQILPDADIYLISYDMAVSDAIFSQLFKKSWGYIICDEGHYLKGWNTKRSRRILGTYKNKFSHLYARTEKIILLTGTPLLNRIEELYNVIIRIAPEALKFMSKFEFLTRFAGRLQYTPWGLKHEGVKNVDVLRGMLKNVMLARSTIADLPPLIHHDIKYPVTDKKIKALIDAEIKFLREHNINIDDYRKLEKLPKGEVSKLADLRIQSAIFKLPLFTDALRETIEEHGACIIAAYHKKTVAAIQALLNKKFKKIKYVVITGNVDKEKRHEYIKAFQSGKYDVIVATISSLKEGVNVTAANVIHFLEFDWTPGNMKQFTGRIHRKKQERTCHVYYHYFNTGIDQLLLRALKSKQRTIDKVMG